MCGLRVDAPTQGRPASLLNLEFHQIILTCECGSKTDSFFGVGLRFKTYKCLLFRAVQLSTGVKVSYNER